MRTLCRARLGRPLGRSSVHQRGDLLSASGEPSCPPLGILTCPLTRAIDVVLECSVRACRGGAPVYVSARPAQLFRSEVRGQTRRLRRGLPSGPPRRTSSACDTNDGSERSTETNSTSAHTRTSCAPTASTTPSSQPRLFASPDWRHQALADKRTGSRISLAVVFDGGYGPPDARCDLCPPPPRTCLRRFRWRPRRPGRLPRDRRRVGREPRA